MNHAIRGIRHVVRQMGYDVVKYQPTTHPVARRRKLLKDYKVNVVLDVGANIGQFGTELRDNSYTGKIISFEPLSVAYKELVKRASADPSWKAMNYALGSADGSTVINVSSNAISSSILDMLPSHVKSSPESKYAGTETIQIKALDSIFESTCSPGERILLKIDTQGYEKYVLEGAEKSLQFINTVQLEMSLIPLYREELLLHEMCDLLYRKGYVLTAIDYGFSDSDTGQLLQVDGLFHRY